MIEFRNTGKYYDGQAAVSGISFRVELGERFGLIGPDGAGKSTLMRILATLLLPDEGSVSFNGRDVVEDYRYVRSHIGYMPGTFSLYHDLTVDENLQFYARVFGTAMRDNYDMIRNIYEQLAPFGKRRAGALSGGMKQKLALCCALVHKPLALVLDEPTTGVDAVSRREFWEMLAGLEEKGITVLVSTPYMDEAAQCHRVALMQDGSVLSTDSPSAIAASYPKRLCRIKADDNYRLLVRLREMHPTWQIHPFGEYLHIATEETVNEGALSESLGSEGFSGIELSQATPDVEDCFIALMSGSGEKKRTHHER